MKTILLIPLITIRMLFVKGVLLASLLLLARLSVAQTFHGQIGDNLTYKPLPEASLWVKDKPIRVQVDSTGNFEMDLSSVADTDLVLISCSGYLSKVLLKQELIDAWYDIKLSPVKTLDVAGLNAEKPEGLSTKRSLKVSWYQSGSVSGDSDFNNCPTKSGDFSAFGSEPLWVILEWSSDAGSTTGGVNRSSD
ncbi:carboxypeptidase-like regulatory domain-containing protein [Spirosoma endbachense]|uniref:Carboxypeptidase-like regulatory domain-containing protein n=1 Tax=Spirosoma endbachense TaxID=2666025 RepID=A0A6P1W8K4_9BACT|nr:carboxypeptidase-like regulatory domain-containing protein [Spirosoma endbachense]QHW00241.1 hypothetical protein GJR95_36775 [Spirosoma endbachense]